MAGIDLSTFKPDSAQSLATGILAQVESVLGADISKFRDLAGAEVASMAKTSFYLAEGLTSGTITPADADLSLHIKELALNSILLQAEFMTYVVAQDVLDAITSVISAAIKSWTGVSLKF